MVGQALFHEFGEKPLIPSVVAWIVTLDLASPIIRESHPFDLICDGSHVSLSDFMRMCVFLDGRIFRRHTKRIEAHWIEDIEAHHALVPRYSIAD